MVHKHMHAAVEIVGKGGKAVEKAESVNGVVKVISASHAFRQYNWLKSVPVRNVAGNMRGMVLSARWRGVYDFSVKTTEVLENHHIAAFASVVVALAESYDEIDAIWQSKEAADIKAAKLSTQATAIAMKVLTGVVTSPSHAVLQALQGYGYFVDLAKGKPLGTCGETLKNMDLAIDSAAKQVSDGEQIYLYINTTINPKISKFLWR